MIDLGINFKETTINKLLTPKNNAVQLAIHILNVDGKGELETILKKIRKHDSTYADCLEAWRNCIESNIKNKGKLLTDKEFDKYWVDHYLRFDTCSKKEQRQASKYCKGERAIKKDGIWNFEDPLLDELKKFLLLFSSHVSST